MLLRALLFHLAFFWSVNSAQAFSKPEGKSLAQAYNIIESIDYLPYGVRRGGCQARGALISMELAARGYASNTYHRMGNVVPIPDDPRMKFTYHIAPALYSDETEGAMIIDPAFLSRPSKVAEWEKALHPDKKPHYHFLRAGSVILDEEVVLVNKRSDTPIKIDEMDKMPPFDGEIINGICAEIVDYLQEDKDGAQKKPKLLAQVNWAAKQLNEMVPAKIDHYDPKIGIKCKFPPRPIPGSQPPRN